MKKQAWIFLFLFALIANITGGILEITTVDLVSKPLLVPLLAGCFVSRTREINSNLTKWFLFALLFSWVGDILLMFQQDDSLFFLLGLSAFLLSHVFYIVFFHLVRVKEQLRSKPWLLVIVVVYYAALISLLSPYLGDMKLPVRIYGIVITFMFLLAMHMLYIKNRKAGQWMMTGALLFVISDSVLAINKFYQPFFPAGAIIMLTYGCAQLFLTEGAIQYIRMRNR